MKINVYLVDDHAVVRDGLHLLLEAHPDIHVVGDAANGRQAVDEVKELRPDVVLMDISIPDLNGIDAAREILTDNPQVGVIILSMLGTSEHIYRAMQAGARGYLLKESAGREVVEAVLAVAAGQNYLSQPVTKTLVADYVDRHEHGPLKSPLESLSVREREILQLVADGKSSAEISKLLYLSPKTIDTYRGRIMHKLGVIDLPGLIKFAIRHGLTPLK